MKKNITISVDFDAWTRASAKVDNLSRYLNECLIGLGGKTLDERTREQLESEIKMYQEQIRELTTKETIAQQSIVALKEAELLRTKENIELEQFNRWICGACKHQNFMDQIRCNGCNLPTRNDKKTVVINIKGD